MADINLENVLNLYKAGKISKYVLEKELTNAAQRNVATEVKVTRENSSNSVDDYFVIATVPEASGRNYSITFFLDEGLFNGVLTSAEIVDVFYREVRNSQRNLAFFSKYLLSKVDSEISRSEAIALYLSIYKTSILNMQPGIREKLVNNDILPEIEDIDRILLKLEAEEESLENIIEEIKIHGIAPGALIEAGKKLAIDFSSRPVSDNGVEKPATNEHYEILKKVCTSTFGIRSSQNIDHNYKPSTNQ